MIRPILETRHPENGLAAALVRRVQQRSDALRHAAQVRPLNMARKSNRILVRILAIFFALLPSLASAQSVTVSAAISMKEALTEAAEQYQKQSGESVRLNFGASGDLANQIVGGAPVDLFISAGEVQIEELQRAKLVMGRPVVLVGNELVLIGPPDDKSLASWEGVKGVKRLCIGDPKSVPAGRYAVEVLNHLGLTGSLEGKLIYAANVRQVLAYIQRGEVDAGIVYVTDARQAGTKVRMVAVAPANSHEPIEYPAAIIRGENEAGARKFLKFLSTSSVQKIFVHFGFVKGPS